MGDVDTQAQPPAPTPPPATPLQEAAELLRQERGHVESELQLQLYARHPNAQWLLRAGKAVPAELVELSIHAIAAADAEGALDALAEARIRDLGLAQRRFGFPSELYQDIQEIMVSLLRTTGADLPFPVEFAAERTIARVCVLLQEAAAKADQEGLPPALSGEVISVRRVSRRLSVVQLATGSATFYQPGTVLPVMGPLTPGVWVPLPAALPANRSGVLEFHIFHEDTGSPEHLLATARLGERWIVGSHGSTAPKVADQELLIIATKSGAAVARCLVTDLVSRQLNPRVHVFLAARYPGELYDAPAWHNLSSLAPRLRVSAVSVEDADPWWVAGPGTNNSSTSSAWVHGSLRSSQHQEFSTVHHGAVAQVVSAFGTWSDRQVLVCGPRLNESEASAGYGTLADAQVMEPTVISRELIEAGVPAENIQVLEF